LQRFLVSIIPDSAVEEDMRRIYLVVVGFMAWGILSAGLLAAQVSVTTWHNDIGRTGQNLNETTLTPGLVGSVNTFGKLCSSTINGQVHAQPLVADVTISGKSYTAVFVVTQGGSLYVFDGINYTAGQPCTQIARRNLMPTGAKALNGGILGTPVIDPVSNTLFLVEAYQTNGVGAHMLHAIDITTTALADKVAPVQISGGTFLSTNEVQRAGLLGLANTPGTAFSTVYIPFSRVANATPNHHGWVFAYSASTLVQSAMYCVTCGTSSANGGGIWMGAAAPAAGVDSTGTEYVYLATGDGTFDLNTGGTDSGDSFLKLGTANLNVADYFTPADQACRICPQQGSEHDIDFGSGGVTLIPDGLLSNFPYLSVVADKEGSIWVIDRTSPGEYGGKVTGKCPTKVCSGTNANVETVQGSTNEFHNSPAYWNGNLYYAASNDSMKSYPLSNTTCSSGSPPLCAAQAVSTATFAYGVTPAVSSNGTSDGVVWAFSGTGAAETTTPGILYALTTDTLATLYTSNLCTVGGVAQDQPGGANSFSVPTVANGRVYVGSMGGSTGGEGGFHMYGSLTRTCDGTADKSGSKK
jgi:hypothetical protein